MLQNLNQSKSIYLWICLKYLWGNIAFVVKLSAPTAIIARLVGSGWVWSPDDFCFHWPSIITTDVDNTCNSAAVGKNTQVSLGSSDLVFGQWGTEWFKVLHVLVKVNVNVLFPLTAGTSCTTCSSCCNIKHVRLNAASEVGSGEDDLSKV